MLANPGVGPKCKFCEFLGVIAVLVVAALSAPEVSLEVVERNFLQKRSGTLWQELSLSKVGQHGSGRAARYSELSSSTCGLPPDPSIITDCDHVDIGSCGNACCELELSVGLSTGVVYEKVKDFLVHGGNSSSFAYVEGEDAMSGENPSDDLRTFNSTPPRPYTFVLQGSHTTIGRHFVDILNFNLRPGDGDNTTVLLLFSMSKIHGALGDAGQNYKTLVYLINGSGMDREDAHIVHGCGCGEHGCQDASASMQSSMKPSVGQM